MNAASTIPHPLRMLGIARIIAGAAFVYTGVISLLDYPFLVPQAAELFGDRGSTDAPLRALLTLSTAAIEVLIGLVLVAISIKWLGSLSLPSSGPAPIAADEVTAILSTRHASAFGDGLTPPHWLLRGPLSDQLADAPWWNRDLMSAGARAFARGWVMFATIAACYLLVHVFTANDLLGPVPTAFVVVLIVVTAMWAVLALMLIPSHGPRIESMNIALSAADVARRPLRPGEIIESAPKLLRPASPALGRTLGILGVATQSAPCWHGGSSLRSAFHSWRRRSSGMPDRSQAESSSSCSAGASSLSRRRSCSAFDMSRQLC